MSVCTLDHLKSGHGNFLYPASFLREKVCPHKRTKCVNIVSYQNEMYITIFQFTVYKISFTIRYYNGKIAVHFPLIYKKNRSCITSKSGASNIRDFRGIIL